jgi:hypothetical protein
MKYGMEKDINIIEPCLKRKDLKKYPFAEIAEYFEIWREIKEFPDYFISTKGRIWSKKRSKILKTPVNQSGYPSFSRKGKMKTIHSIVLETFVSDRPKGMICHHKDCIRINNCISNLEWSTYSKNTKHAYLSGLIKASRENKAKGEKSGKTKLTEKEVFQIRNLYNKGEDIKKIAFNFNISENGVYSICSGRTWKDSFNYNLRKKSKLNKKQLEEIKKLRKEGWKNVDIANKFKITDAYVSQICLGRRKVIRLFK